MDSVDRAAQETDGIRRALDCARELQDRTWTAIGALQLDGRRLTKSQARDQEALLAIGCAGRRGRAGACRHDGAHASEPSPLQPCAPAPLRWALRWTPAEPGPAHAASRSARSRAARRRPDPAAGVCSTAWPS
jgi:hypothetical protein